MSFLPRNEYRPEESGVDMSTPVHPVAPPLLGIVVGSTINNVFPLNTSLNTQLDKYTVSIKQAVKNLGLLRNNNNDLKARQIDDVIETIKVSLFGGQTS